MRLGIRYAANFSLMKGINNKMYSIGENILTKITPIGKRWNKLDDEAYKAYSGYRGAMRDAGFDATSESVTAALQNYQQKQKAFEDINKTFAPLSTAVGYGTTGLGVAGAGYLGYKALNKPQVQVEEQATYSQAVQPQNGTRLASFSFMQGVGTVLRERGHLGVGALAGGLLANRIGRAGGVPDPETGELRPLNGYERKGLMLGGAAAGAGVGSLLKAGYRVARGRM